MTRGKVGSRPRGEDECAGECVWRCVEGPGRDIQAGNSGIAAGRQGREGEGEDVAGNKRVITVRQRREGTR